MWEISLANLTMMLGLIETGFEKEEKKDDSMTVEDLFNMNISNASKTILGNGP